MAKYAWSPERRAEASRKAKERMGLPVPVAERIATSTDGGVTVAERPVVSDTQPVAAEEPDDPTSENVLSQLAGLFQKASGEKQGRDKAVSEALDLLGKLDPFKYPDIADNPAVLDFVDKVQMQRAQAQDLPPGTIIGSGIGVKKIPWTKAHLLKGKGMPPAEAVARGFIEWIEYRPIKNFDVTWNGIRIIWPARRLGYFPKSHTDVFEQSLDAEHWNEQHAAWLFNNPDAEVHRDYFSTTGPRLKAMDASKGEYYQPGAGLISMAPSPDLIGGGEEGAA